MQMDEGFNGYYTKEGAGEKIPLSMHLLFQGQNTVEVDIQHKHMPTRLALPPAAPADTSSHAACAGHRTRRAWGVSHLWPVLGC